LAGGEVNCWGYNGNGELGNDSLNNESKPVAVSGLSGVVAVAAGVETTCAILAARTIDCWGAGTDGALGNGTETASREAALPVTGLTNVTQVAVGGQQACALEADGQPFCWGDDDYFGPTGSAPTSGAIEDKPEPVETIHDATAIATGVYHTCAIVTGGTVKCWGWNDLGQLGSGNEESQVTPQTVIGLSDAGQISLGELTRAPLPLQATSSAGGLVTTGRSVSRALPLPMRPAGAANWDLRRRLTWMERHV
jgi:alpha-tubulin suppressor-like RCC1 family protein